MANKWPDFEAVVILDENGAQVTNFGGSGGTSMSDDDPFIAAASSFTPVGGIVTADSVDSGDGGAFAMLANRQQKITLYDSAAAEVTSWAVTNAGLTELAAAINTNRVDVNIAADGVGIGGGTQYTEGDIDASITGTAAMMEVAANTLQPVQGTVADGLLVNLGANNDVTVTGTVTANAGTDLNTSALLTTAAHDAAFGTAGTADAQVRSIQGIASMTPVQVSQATAASLNMTEASAAAIKTAVEIIDNAIAGSEMQVDVVAALPAGTNNIGDVDVLSVVPGTAATNLGKAEDGGHTTGDTGVFALGVRNDTPNTALAGTDLDYIALATYRTGAIRTAIPEEDFAALGSNHVKKYLASTGAVTDGIVWSPAAGKRWYVTDMIITTSAAATVTIEDDVAAGDVVVLALDLAANSGIAHHFATPLFSQEDAADLLITTSAGNSKITVVGYEV